MQALAATNHMNHTHHQALSFNLFCFELWCFISLITSSVTLFVCTHFLLKLIILFLLVCFLGGHNLLYLARDLGQYVQLGMTTDDAMGEALDKTAKLLGLDLRSGGPAVEELAWEGDAKSVKFSMSSSQTLNTPLYLLNLCLTSLGRIAC